MRLPTPNLLAVTLAVQALFGHGLEAGLVSYAPEGFCEVNPAKYTILRQCPRADWSSTDSSDQDGANIRETTSETTIRTEQGSSGGSGTRDGAADEDVEDLATSSFMSFEEWKAMMLQKTGQDPADLKERKRREGRDSADVGPKEILDSWGDDGEIALDFDALPGSIADMTATASARSSGETYNAEEKVPAVRDDGMAHYRRPKDAGKTCKERFSYASFDGGATILKTSPGAQNPKAILVENKDAYMLFTCSQENKFVIIELSEDILVDTVVLANFEFFSSTIRNFRVSVSDKYPVKMDKWKDIGTYQARNSRDIQSFLIENPKIYAKYIRIEFLSHYGKEYYCPVSLLRVHGTRMLDSWKDVENAVSDDDESLETVDSTVAVPEPEVSQENVVSEPKTIVPAEHRSQNMANNSIREYGTSPWLPLLYSESHLKTCAISTPTTMGTAQAKAQVHWGGGNISSIEANSISKEAETITKVTEAMVSSTAVSPSVTSSSSISKETAPSIRTSQATGVSIPSSGAPGDKAQAAEQAVKPPVTATRPPPPASKSDGSSSKPTQKHSPNTVANKNSTGSSSSAAASPTIQESFFKSITKRITYLEGNVTLSLQYIEEQSKFLQDALQKMERRQIKRVDDFLHNLNRTVLSDIVMNLESHRQMLDRHDRQILALSSQLNLLAGDVGLLKLLMITLVVLNACCLMLLLVSRGMQRGTAAEQWANTGQFFNTYLGSPRLPPGSPQSARSAGNVTPTQRLLRRQSAGGSVMRHNSSSSLHPDGQRSVSGPLAASPRDKVLPLTPTSDVFDRSDNDTSSPTPPSSTRRKVVRSPPQIRIDEPDDIFAEDGDGSDVAVTGLGASSRPLIEELPTPSDEASSFDHSREEVQSEYESGEAYEDDGEPSKPPLTRSPLSELGGISRKPLPALPEDPT